MSLYLLVNPPENLRAKEFSIWMLRLKLAEISEELFKKTRGGECNGSTSPTFGPGQNSQQTGKEQTALKHVATDLQGKTKFGSCCSETVRVQYSWHIFELCDWQELSHGSSRMCLVPHCTTCLL